MNTCFVSTSIPYVNARPHLGFALELVQADVIARWNRLCGRDTFFLSGTDENALKNVQVAHQEGIIPQQLCDRNAVVFQQLIETLHISTDRFIRTSGTLHHRGAEKFWKACRADDLFKKRYRGLYCVGCEDFYLEKDLSGGLCPVHQQAPEVFEEENYFFRLSAYQEQLQQLIDSDTLRILPESRRNEALGIIRQGLHDFSVSRISERSGGWGIPVPGDASQVLYVWFDALTNYITGLGYGSDSEEYARYWLRNARKIHVIGKDILRFHTVYWPALLLSAGEPLPSSVLVHGFLTVNGRKISKSLGDAVDPFPLVERYGVDALRYYLLRSIPSGADGDFSETRLQEVYTADLANGLGNLVQRVAVLCQKAGVVIDDSSDDRNQTAVFLNEVAESIEAFRLHDALAAIWTRIRTLNQAIEAERPWELLKQKDTQVLGALLNTWVRELRRITATLSPFLPETAERIASTLSGDVKHPVSPLFPRL